MRKGCPVSCKEISYKNKISAARFLHNPPTGLERDILSVKVQKYKGISTESHLMKLLDMKGDRDSLDKHIE